MIEHRCLSPWKGAVAGGLVAFAWHTGSWLVLPFHDEMISTIGGRSALVTALGLSLLMQMTGSFFWTWILGKIPGLTLKDSARYGLFFGLCLGFLGAMRDWAWGDFPLPVALMRLADHAIAWTLASMVLSRCYAAVCALPEKR